MSSTDPTPSGSDSPAAGVRLVLFGRQGAGKGTQCARLATHFGVPHISTGDMLRAAVADGTEFGRRAKEIMDRGDLVSDEVMLGVVGERLGKPDASAGWLLDGFPRTPGQARALDDLAKPPMDLAIDLDVAEDVVIGRIVNRRVCRECGTIYTASDAAAGSGVCAACGGSVVQRDDDTEEAVRKRLSLYSEQTEPLLDFYRERRLLVTVDGVGSSDEVFERILTAVARRTQA